MTLSVRPEGSLREPQGNAEGGKSCPRNQRSIPKPQQLIELLGFCFLGSGGEPTKSTTCIRRKPRRHSGGAFVSLPIRRGRHPQNVFQSPLASKAAAAR